ncbi:aminopeptidase P family protein [Erythrobacteraceae bacterium CFH 75059]|uniref:aminopeptidase P family protein n=1 Tax=Qipengyuania thermophila TaxID=2509361 RepID=UPI0010202A40|nr:aminopeptidase P family protein [Qipengyuania thermophila]TCD06520.1 aminopeptidase P family protein [Erythrobacteraceae bacterium CFH 75059]
MLQHTLEARLSALREELVARGLDGFVVPISDEHMSEYVGDYAQRLAWLTGFGGSAGSAVVLSRGYEGRGAAVFVDGRYTLQVRDQVPAALYEHVGVPQSSVAQWLADHAPDGARIGYDPWLHTAAFVRTLTDALRGRGGVAVAVDDNPVDAIWPDQPLRSAAPVMLHAHADAGEDSASKRARIADALSTAGEDSAVIAALDSVAWLFNIRGTDVAHSPLALAFALAHADGTADLFLAAEKQTPDLAAHLGNAVRLHDRDAFVPALGALGGKRVRVDPERSVAAITQALESAGATVVAATDPTVLPKAIKNRVEQDGHRAAQVRDGAAVARFLHWLSVTAPRGEVDELSAAARLHAFREDTGLLVDTSFDTISGAGPNGAVVHYRATEETNRLLEPGSLYLVDSGGQYRDGTTDITRTVWIDTLEGTAPTAEMRDRFTRVLKGHIALAAAVFPEGTSGGQLDVLARQHLWAAGLDYAHGTGHGVGSFLCVHEGPARIAKPQGGQAGTAHPLHAGMILSNEPGFYKEGAWGIRIENLVLVEPRALPGAETGFLGFETLTFAPIDRRLVEPGLLSEAERTWLDDYHAQVLRRIGPQLDGDVLAWLEEQCAPL